jgi:hypothetical protein
MGGGYVLNFSDKTFREFFDEYVGRDIDDPRYLDKGTSKANRLRSFWEIEPNWLVAKCLTELIEHSKQDAVKTNHWATQVQECQAIIARLAADLPVADIASIAASTDERDFEGAAKAARESIANNQPELGLDRLHTFVVKFVRSLCEGHGLEVGRDIPLNGLVGAYVKRLKEQGHLGSEMAERILKSSISNLEAFNHVRNKHTLAHDNPILTYDEALLIFSHVASSVRFMKALELRIGARLSPAETSGFQDGDIPF